MQVAVAVVRRILPVHTGIAMGHRPLVELQVFAIMGLEVGAIGTNLSRRAGVAPLSPVSSSGGIGYAMRLLLLQRLSMEVAEGMQERLPAAVLLARQVSSL